METVAQGGSGDSRRTPRPTQPVSGGSPLLNIYKSGQGQYVRWLSAAAMGILAVWFSNDVYDQFDSTVALSVRTSESTRLIIATAAAALTLVGSAWLIFWLFGRSRRMCDFLIATEGEMKKVNWSSRREVMGSTKVVIFVVFAMSLLLFIADLIFIAIFGRMGVLKIDLLGQVFGGP